MRTGICLFVILVGLIVSACTMPLPYDQGGAAPVAQTTATPVVVTPSPAAATTAPYDAQALDSLIRQQQQASELLAIAETKAQHRELKEFARQRRQSLQRDLAQLQAWRTAWFPTQPATSASTLPGMQPMSAPTDKLQTLTGQEFDQQFLAVLIESQQGAAELARDILNHGEHAELKQFAAQLQQDYPQQIEQLRTWQNSW